MLSFHLTMYIFCRTRSKIDQWALPEQHTPAVVCWVAAYNDRTLNQGLFNPLLFLVVLKLQHQHLWGGNWMECIVPHIKSNNLGWYFARQAHAHHFSLLAVGPRLVNTNVGIRYWLWGSLWIKSLDLHLWKRHVLGRLCLTNEGLVNTIWGLGRNLWWHNI